MNKEKSLKGLEAGLKMDDIARLAGVSKSTVSRALSDSPLVNEKTKEKIRELALEHSYVVDQRARNFRLRQTGMVTVAIPVSGHDDQHISDPFFLDLLGHLADGLTERGYDLLLSKASPSRGGWLESLVTTRRSDGLILMGQSTQHETINQLAEFYRPMVVWGTAMADQRYISVGSDNYLGGKLATEHLIGLGRRRIAFLGDFDHPEIHNRYRGYCAALGEAGIKLDDSLMVPVLFESEASYDGMVAFLDKGEPIDAVIAGSDVIAMSAIRALKERDLSVPSDVSVVGYDDVTLAAYIDPPLTTIRQDTKQAAELLLDRLFQLMGGEDASSAVIETRLVVRASCGASTRS